jgi:hypothetical protein
LSLIDHKMHLGAPWDYTSAADISHSGMGENSTLELAITTERFGDFLALDCRLLRLTGGAETN